MCVYVAPIRMCVCETRIFKINSLIVVVVTCVTIKNTFHRIAVMPMYEDLKNGSGVTIISMQTLRCTYFGDASRLLQRYNVHRVRWIAVLQSYGIQTRTYRDDVRAPNKERIRDFLCATRRRFYTAV